MSNIVYSSKPQMMRHDRANVYIQPNRYCNYSCSYCFPGASTKVKDFVNAEKLYKTIDDLCKQFYDRGVKHINWGWSGGEATFHPNFLDFQKQILSHDYLVHSFNMTSNISHNLSWWKKFIKVTDKYFHRSISASLHQEFVNTPEKIEKFKQKCKYLRNNIETITVNQVMDIDIFDNQLEIMKQITKDVGIGGRPKINTVLYKQYRKYTGTDGYDSDQMETMTSHYKNQDHGKKYYAAMYQLTDEGEEIKLLDPEQLKLNKFHENLKDWICTAGYLSIAITKDTIKRGVGACGSGKRMNILGAVGEDFSLYTEPRVCGMEKPCTCTADLKLPKWKKEFDIENFIRKTKDDPDFIKHAFKID